MRVFNQIDVSSRPARTTLPETIAGALGAARRQGVRLHCANHGIQRIARVIELTAQESGVHHSVVLACGCNRLWSLRKRVPKSRESAQDTENYEAN